MILYDFKCIECDNEFEYIIDKEQNNPPCPICGSITEKCIGIGGGTNFILKGTGWYRTDYQKNYYRHPANKNNLKNKN